MREFKGTPSPWRVRNEHGFLLVEAPKELINKPYGQEILGDDYFDDFNKMADCILIANAPELLKTLEKLLNRIDEMLTYYEGELPDGVEEFIVPVMAEADELITIATQIK